MINYKEQIELGLEDLTKTHHFIDFFGERLLSKHFPDKKIHAGIIERNTRFYFFTTVPEINNYRIVEHKEVFELSQIKGLLDKLIGKP